MNCCRFVLALAFLVSLPVSWGQSSIDSYDDYSTFTVDPEELDREAIDIFGRHFQMNFSLGSAVALGNLGRAYAAGINGNLRFVFYFDRIWAVELSGGFIRSNGLYDDAGVGLTTTNTVNVQLQQTIIPVSGGVRYGFDLQNLPRGFATLNPYLSVNAASYFRQEKVIGEPVTVGLSSDLQGKFVADNVLRTTAFGFNLGGGLEFDVYKRRLFMGVDLRYHTVFWPDATVAVGEIDRSGNFVTILGTATYSY